MHSVIRHSRSWSTPVLAASMIKVALLGHSYVKYLPQHMDSPFSNENGTEFHCNYFYRSGATFASMINDDILQEIREFHPDIILVIMGGNDIKDDVDNKKIYDRCLDFYKKIQEDVPAAAVIAAEVEMRFYEEGNNWGCPTEDTFNKRRRCLNKFVYKHCPIEDMMYLGGPGIGLNTRENFMDDGVHLNSAGLEIYCTILQRKIKNFWVY